MSRRLAHSSTALSLLALLAVGSVPRPAAADNLSVALFSDERESLWPVEVTMEIVPLSEGASIDTPVHKIVVADGQHLDFADVVRTPLGSCSFDLRIVARHHANDAVEVEYDLRVAEARFRGLTWTGYLLHRLHLAPRPEVGPSALTAARADIVEDSAQVHREVVAAGGETFEIRIRAKSLRG